jgi:hypothetical protein
MQQQLLISLFLTCCLQSVRSQSHVQIDTFIFDPGCQFQSKMKVFINDCLGSEVTGEVSRLEAIKKTQRDLNKETKSTFFDSLQIVTIISYYLIPFSAGISIMEWHFSSQEKVRRCDALLHRLRGGETHQGIVPSKFKWIPCEKKVLLIDYGSEHLEAFGVIASYLSCMEKMKE